MLYTWEFKEIKGGHEPPYLLDWAKKLSISPFLTKLLWNRGILSLDEMSVFLSPHLRYLDPLEYIDGLVDAANFISDKLKQGTKIGIWGDYDVDGITSSCILIDFFKKKGVSPIYHIPHRIKEGYGLNIEGLKEFIKQGVGCVITVDCGIGNLEEIKWLRSQGIDVVVSDHHVPLNKLPDANYIINPKLGSRVYCNLAGVGIAFLLMAALNKLLPDPIDIREYLDLVALGTIADVVPMDIKNRILVKNGLLMLSETKRPGIVALKEVSGIGHGSQIGAQEVGFILGPRINAAGRMSKGIEALELLLCEDIDKARKIAKKLDEYNKQRKKQEDSILKQAIEMAESKSGLSGLVLYGEDWHPGIIGIVASKICDKYYRPTFLLTGKQEIIKGSGRSIPEVDLSVVLTKCANVLKKYGGHPQAGGVSLSPDQLHAFEELFVKSIEDILGYEKPSPVLNIDANVPLNRIDYNFVKELQLLEPFGPGNPEPIFCSNVLRILKHKIIGNGHVFLELRDERANKTMWGKAWNMKEVIPKQVMGKEVKVAFCPRISSYNGLIGIDLQVKDIDIIP